MSNLNEGFKVPDMSKVGIHQTSELGIINRLNESHNRAGAQGTKPMNESAGEATCPCCGATWTPSVTTEDGASQLCPVCGSTLMDPNQPGVQDSAVEDEQHTEEMEQAKLESTLQEYINLVDAGSMNEAKQLIESAEAKVICEACEDGTSDIMLEKFVIKVDSTGHKTKKKVRTKKMKRTAAQKAALRKARKSANKSAAKKKRKKAMKARARLGLNESIRKTQISHAIMEMLESQGVTSVSAKAVNRAINEAYHMNGAEVQLPEEKALSTLETILGNHGLEVTDSETKVTDGVLIASVSVKDTDAEVYLGDIADEVEDSLDGYAVDYDEPDDPDENGIVDIDFYFVPQLQVNESEDNSDDGDKKDPENKDDGKKEPTNECDDPKAKKMNESMKVGNYDALFESMAGGVENIRCKMNPAFIKPNQVILDAGEGTVFKALTESVAVDGGFKMAVEICNSKNAELAGLVPGAEVTLSSDGDYFLMRSNPMA